MINTAYNTFKLFIPRQAVGASLIYFDLWNPTGSGKKVLVHGLVPVVSTAVAVTAALGIDLFIQRTTAIGTGGTAATFGGSDQAAATFASLAVGATYFSQITARLTPSGGATAGAILGWHSQQGEESLSSVQQDIWRRGMTDIPPFEIKENAGFSVVQGSVAGVGNIGFDILLQITDK